MRFRISLAVMGLAGLFCLGTPQAVSAQSSQCADRETYDVTLRIRYMQVFCPNQNGVSVPVRLDDGLPPEFTGTLSYGTGTYEGSETVGRRAPRQRSHAGSFQAQLWFDGRAVTGVYDGSDGISRTRFSGTRDGDRCRLTSADNTATVDARCTPTTFSGVVRSTFSARVPFEVRFNAERTVRPTGAALAAANAFPLDRCGTMSMPAPRNQAELDALATYTLLSRGAAVASDWMCSTLYFGAAAARDDVQGMAAYSYGFSTDSPTPDEAMQTYWCQKAYRQARVTGVSSDLDAVNHFCPIDSIAALMTPAERRANNVSVVRAAQTEAAIRERAEAQARQAFDFAVAMMGSGGPDAPNSGEGDFNAARENRENVNRQLGRSPD